MMAVLLLILLPFVVYGWVRGGAIMALLMCAPCIFASIFVTSEMEPSVLRFANHFGENGSTGVILFDIAWIIGQGVAVACGPFFIRCWIHDARKQDATRAEARVRAMMPPQAPQPFHPSWLNSRDR